ncbi:MAG TPA: limonene-1,2-epoxide hydrolase family protein [Steroidobacteraceae bacterium]|nr:limonene-1,2-epoxide hydrolase family protein [Steroidobacteraceae bacterium]
MKTRTPPAPLARRELLGMVGAGAVLGALAALPVRAAEGAGSPPTSQGRDSLRIVNAFCAAWSTLDAAMVLHFFADNAVYRVTETTPPAVGRAAITPLVQRFLQRAQQVRFEILREYSVGPIVLTERHDHFRGPQGERIFHVAGVFFVRDGKIAEWTDYIVRP